ncbi:hypothetical protein HYH03_012258 [Edaphochlamys debaryana]|uniref:EGF-like domain-containing protein n=1 Tax=Edaphochlamys debaryana TaxID=47281 RepID=A0A836BUP7_9CHLO|nr:hypothetical protein HYH03_012258 [Edaphochlamys debaryana]|eukprot:KAG2489237.1 hypothetical protein HYH03_012258 [Edaphochlamys debaryana]
MLVALGIGAAVAQSPIVFTIEYKLLDSLSANQQVMLKDAVNAAYQTIQRYVLPPKPTSRLLSERVCRTYGTVGSPPPRSPWPPAPPLEPPEPPLLSPPPRARRSLLADPATSSAAEGGAVASGAASALAAAILGASASDSGAGSAAASGSRGGAGAASSQRRRRLQQGAPGSTFQRCYPSFDGTPRLDRCGLAPIMAQHVRSWNGSEAVSLAGTPGEVTDLYLYITAARAGDGTPCTPAGGWNVVTTGTCPTCGMGMEIKPVTCLYDSATGRPTMASINVCPVALDSYSLDTLVARLTWAMLQALGVERVGFYGLRPVAAAGSALVGNMSDGAGNPLEFLATPNVTQVVRSHFSCPSAPGALLEDAFYGRNRLSDSSVVLDTGEVLLDTDYLERSQYVFAGWETSHFQGDILVADFQVTPRAANAPQVTQLTLALLLDTSWYGVNVNNQGYWTWGQGRGCAMALNHCSALVNATSSAGEAPLFCNPDTAGNQTLCAPGYGTVGTCRGDAYFLGASCGLVAALNDDLPTCANRELEISELSDGELAISNMFGWQSGFSSRCANVVWPWSSRKELTIPLTTFPSDSPNPPAGASCFAASCVNGELSYNVLGTWVRCPSGQTVNLTGVVPAGTGLLSGVLGPCPPNADVCASLGCSAATCSPAGGECRGGRCYCRPGWSGPACASSLMQGTSQDLGALASAYALQEISIILRDGLSTFYARQGQFLQLVADSMLQYFSTPIKAQLSVARMDLMSSFPDYELPATPPHIMVVVRFAAASALQASLFEKAFAGGMPAATQAELGRYFSVASNSSAYLGQTVLRASPPPFPPSPPSPPPVPPSPPPTAPPSSDAGGGGLTGDEKVAIGVGVSFGVLLLLTLAVGYCSFRNWQTAQTKLVKHERDRAITRLRREIEEEEKKLLKAAPTRPRAADAPLSHEEIELVEGRGGGGGGGGGPVSAAAEITVGAGGRGK